MPKLFDAVSYFWNKSVSLAVHLLLLTLHNKYVHKPAEVEMIWNEKMIPILFVLIIWDAELQPLLSFLG